MCYSKSQLTAVDSATVRGIAGSIIDKASPHCHATAEVLLWPLIGPAASLVRLMSTDLMSFVNPPVIFLQPNTRHVSHHCHTHQHNRYFVCFITIPITTSLRLHPNTRTDATMVKNRKEKPPKAIKLRQPDRSGPTEQTLLQLADDQQLFKKAAKRERQLAGDDSNDDDEEGNMSPGAERFLEALLYTATLATLHVTFDVLVMNQYGTEIKWDRVIKNAGRALIGKFHPFCDIFFQRHMLKSQAFFILFYALHPSEPHATLIPGLPRRFQRPLRQLLFFAMSCVAGCALVYTTNAKGYLANMKSAPPLGCIWLWAVVELDLLWAVPSLAVAGVYMWVNGYSIK